MNSLRQDNDDEPNHAARKSRTRLFSLRIAIASSFFFGSFALTWYGMKFYYDHLHYGHCSGMNMTTTAPTSAPTTANSSAITVVPMTNQTSRSSATYRGMDSMGIASINTTREEIQQDGLQRNETTIKPQEAKTTTASYSPSAFWTNLSLVIYTIGSCGWIVAGICVYLTPLLRRTISSTPRTDNGVVVPSHKNNGSLFPSRSPTIPLLRQTILPPAVAIWRWILLGLVVLPSLLVCGYGAYTRYAHALEYYGFDTAGTPTSFQDWTKQITYILAMPSGTAGMVSMGVYVFGTVAKHSPLWSVYAVLPEEENHNGQHQQQHANLMRDALRLHQWAGYITIVWFDIHTLCYLCMYGFDATIAASKDDDGNDTITTARYIAIFVKAMWDAVIPPPKCRPIFGIGPAEQNATSSETGVWKEVAGASANNQTVHPRSPCAGYYRNLSGIISMAAFGLLVLTSLTFVRRKNYRFFYASHIVSASIAVLTMIFHVRRIAIYLMPSLLCYFSTTIPTVVQAMVGTWLDGGVEIESYKALVASSSRNHHESGGGDEQDGCGELTFSVDESTMPLNNNNEEGNIIQHRPKSVKICVPSISSIWYPFTVIETKSKSNGSVRCTILFGTVGYFTKTLWKQLKEAQDEENKASQQQQEKERTAVIEEFLDEDNKNTTEKSARRLPLILVDGFYSGGTDWIASALRHDVVAIVAGGTGVTPFLDFFPKLIGALTSPTISANIDCTSRTDLESGTLDASNKDLSSILKDVTFLWCCRDEALIRHVVKTYFLQLFLLAEENETSEQESLPPNRRFRLVIHNTSRDPEDESLFELIGNTTAVSSMRHPVLSSISTTTAGSKLRRGLPMRPSKFYYHPSSSFASRFLGFGSFLSVAILGILIHHWASDYMTYEHYRFRVRAYGVYVMILWCVLLGVFAEVLWRCRCKIQRNSRYTSVDDGVHFDQTPLERGDDNQINQENNQIPVENIDLHIDRMRDRDECIVERKLSGLYQLRPGKPHRKRYENGSLLEFTLWNGRPKFDHDGDQSANSNGSSNRATLQNIVEAERPGVFYCGPDGLLATVKAKVVAGRRTINATDLHSCVFYEESFEM